LLRRRYVACRYAPMMLRALCAAEARRHYVRAILSALARVVMLRAWRRAHYDDVRC